MLEVKRYDDVTRVVMSTAVSRAVGYNVSAYLTRECLIDTGFPAVGREFAAFIDAAHPRAVILTHHHEDHAGNVELLARGGMPIAAADLTLELLRASNHIGLYRRVVWGRPPALTSPVTRFAPSALRLVPAPGHSIDHHVVWDAERETVFSGDLFLGVKVRVAHESENVRTLAATLRAVANLRPVRLFDSHRGLVTSPVSQLLAKADWLDETIAAIDREIAAGRPDRLISDAVLGREDFTYYATQGSIGRINFVRSVRATSKASTASTGARS